MHTIVETPSYLAAAKAAGMDEAMRLAVIKVLMATPDAGATMKETGGFRKVRFALKDGGKSGGVRVITFYSGPDIPLFLIDVFAKGDKDNLTKGERNELAKLAKILVDTYARKAEKRGKKK